MKSSFTFGTPQEVVDAVLWLCSDPPSFVTGQLIAVYGSFYSAIAEFEAL